VRGGVRPGTLDGVTQIWGHRGASADAPENTLPAFALALGQGADGVELDVQLTRDHEVVVIHDETLERTTDGHGWVADHSLAALRSLDASAGRPGFSGTQIPLLAEVLELVRDSDAVVNIELKTDDIPYLGIEEKVLEVVAASGVADQVLFSSFNHYTLANLRKLGAAQPLGALVAERLFKPWRYAESVPVAALHPSYKACTRKLVAKCHKRGVAVHTWTVDDPKDITKQLRLGVDAIITDVPGLAVQLRDELAVRGLEPAVKPLGPTV
jgi:glycerophosphoryl diester phosphodiesterase